MSRVAIVVFPGTNCEHDVAEALRALGAECELVWHAEPSLEGFDAVVLPGGFAHGDYLRPGAIARFSPVMRAVEELAACGAPVVGICNGFQVLTEAGLLEGALQKNAGLKFVCRWVRVQVTSAESPITAGLDVGRVLELPVNHFEGNYRCDPTTHEALRKRGGIVLRYLDNPNGSLDAIAGVCNASRNVVGLMPHPERASLAHAKSLDGRLLLESLLAWLEAHRSPATTRPSGASSR